MTVRYRANCSELNACRVAFCEKAARQNGLGVRGAYVLFAIERSDRSWLLCFARARTVPTFDSERSMDQ